MAKLDPIVSEFETSEEAEAYDAWFRTKVQKALDDPRPGIPHDEAMAELTRRLEAKRRARGSLDA
ncbi:type II toxin-antitoxin system RelB family antitoxin [Sphingomonas sp. GlSt437]|uniref:type II toxin-antitoxin system RelB family antitoxin n=1 Tax=Sphingomonas sp. GlSt437 TaxID=3389970 RepID=UPI003A88564C